MPLKFRCACSKVLKVPDSMEGQWVRCPGCGGMSPVTAFIRVAAKPGSIAAPIAKPAPVAAAPAEPDADVDDSLEIVCDCGKILRVPAEMAGKQYRCPACKTVLTSEPPAEDE